MGHELFPPMWKVVPEGRRGHVAVEHFEVSESASRLTALRGGRGYVPPGKYAALRLGTDWQRETLMSDTPYERRTNTKVVQHATGRVLIAGYGLGMILTAVLKKPDVQQVVVVEKDADVLALVDPAIRTHVGARAEKKLIVLQDDIFIARQRFGGRGQLGGRFDCIYFDIWGDVSTDALAEMTALTRTYRALKRSKESFMDCWDREWLRYRREQERRAVW